MIDELANVSPNGNRICNWNLQLECNCRKLHRRICNWKNTRSGSPLFCSTTAELLVNEGFADTMLQVCLSTEWTQLVLLLFARRQVTSTLHEVRDKTNTFKSYKRPTWQAIVLNHIKTYRQFASIFPVFFQLHILLCSFLQLHSSCIPVANSSCKFYLHWGKHSQAQKLSKQILIRCQVSMIDELANVSPNGNRICNWNLQLECNWNATAGNCTEEYVTGKTHAVVVLVKMVLFHYSRIAR